MRALVHVAGRRSAAVLAAASLLLQPVVAYEVPLDSRAVREAYFLGQRNDETRAKFLESYRKRFPLPEKGPHISEVELLTPYAQVVNFSQQHTVGYSAQQAEEEYKKRGDFIQVRVRIEFTPSYGPIEKPPPSRDSRAGPGLPIRRDDFWKDFQIRLSEGGERIEPLDIYGEPIFIRGSGVGWGGLAGAQVWLYFDTEDVASAEATVEVVGPDGQKVTAKFDLEKLR